MPQAGSNIGVPPLALLKEMSGLEFLKRIIDGRLPRPPITQTLGFDLTEATPGFALFTMGDERTQLRTFPEALLRRNIIRHIENLRDPSQKARVIELWRVENAVVEKNLIKIDRSQSIDDRAKPNTANRRKPGRIRTLKVSHTGVSGASSSATHTVTV